MSHRFLRAWQAVQAILPGRRPCLFAFVIPDGLRRCRIAPGSIGGEMLWEYTTYTGEWLYMYAHVMMIHSQIYASFRT
jgi:hypothetical protein